MWGQVHTSCPALQQRVLLQVLGPALQCPDVPAAQDLQEVPAVAVPALAVCNRAVQAHGLLDVLSPAHTGFRPHGGQLVMLSMYKDALICICICC